MSVEIPDALADYFAAREREREEANQRAWASLTRRERRLVREAAVMGYVQGVRAEHARPGHDCPHDLTVVRLVLDACRSFVDLYPLLGRLGGTR